MAALAAERDVIRIEPDGNLADALRAGAESGEPLLIRVGDLLFEVDVLGVRSIGDRDPEAQRFTVTDIFGLGASTEPGSIAEQKDQFIADAYDYRRQ